MTERLKGVLHFPPAPENGPGIISKTVDVSLCKEGSSCGFVLRGEWTSYSGAGGRKVVNSNSVSVLFCFHESIYKSDISDRTCF